MMHNKLPNIRGMSLFGNGYLGDFEPSVTSDPNEKLIVVSNRW